MGCVAVVTDSTAGLTDEQCGEAITVVPLQVVVGGVGHDESAAMGPEQVASALRAGTAVSTSRPAPQAFLDAFTRAAEAGATDIVSLHLSAALSGTYESAVLAARDAPVPVQVVDSRSMGMGLGFLVLEAARLAAEGVAAEQIAEQARRRALASRAYFYVATLEHLRRGGRIGAAAAFVGSALAIKPLLVLDDGVIRPLEKVRTSTRALTRLADLTSSAAESAAGPAGPAEVAVHHLDAADRAEALAATLGDRLGRPVPVGQVSAVVGAHVGPGLVAAVVVPRR